MKNDIGPIHKICLFIAEIILLMPSFIVSYAVGDYVFYVQHFNWWAWLAVVVAIQFVFLNLMSYIRYVYKLELIYQTGDDVQKMMVQAIQEDLIRNPRE